jgi:hypothetical protein
LLEIELSLGRRKIQKVLVKEEDKSPDIGTELSV